MAPYHVLGGGALGSLVAHRLRGASLDVSPACSHQADYSIASLTSCVQTMSTVGYGDYSPSLPETKIFVIFMIFFGIIFVFSKVAADTCSLRPVTCTLLAALSSHIWQPSSAPCLLIASRFC